jgi:site-specific recombinase XerD
MKISRTDRGQKALLSLERRLRVSNRSEQTIRNYVRCVKALMDYHHQLPDELEIDQVIDFLNELQVEQERAWRTIKIYVAAFRWFYEHILQAKEFAGLIPYPREKPSLPQIISREELARLFNNCTNKKHRAMFRLLYSSGLRRNELLYLKIEDIITTDGKNRIRINKGKGGKDRYTVLSENVLLELRDYFKVYKPVTYLFNGREPGQRMSPAGLRHAMIEATKKAGISRNINLHILRHCFASHALEEGMNIKTLQYLMGHSSVHTTMVYLHVSGVPLEKAFSPLDKWERP